MDSQALYERYSDLQQYVGWVAADVERIHSVASALVSCFPQIVCDFYDEIERHPEARRVITGGAQQIERLKGSLRQWLEELFLGNYDLEYVVRRWRVGLRHAQIELNQVFVNAAMSRLRCRVLELHARTCRGTVEELLETRSSINRLIDLDLAIIQDAYQTEFLNRQRLHERLATIGQVSGGIAHELRNPLNVIKTSIYFVKNAERISPEKLTTHLDRIDRQATLADRVITALHDFARLPLPRFQSVDLRPLLAEIARDNPAPAGIQWEIDCVDELPPACVDPDQLNIVFANLIRNAFDAMPEGGRLTVSARLDGKYLQVQVTDTGAGMSPEILRRVMEPFQSTKARGLGLGLAIVRAILDRHHASIRVTSQPGVGTTFTIVLPTYSADPLRQDEP